MPIWLPRSCPPVSPLKDAIRAKGPQQLLLTGPSIRPAQDLKLWGSNRNFLWLLPFSKYLCQADDPAVNPGALALLLREECAVPILNWAGSLTGNPSTLDGFPFSVN